MNEITTHIPVPTFNFLNEVTGPSDYWETQTNQPWSPLSVSSVRTASTGDGVGCAVIRVEQQEDVRVNGGVGYDGHSDYGLQDSTPRLVTPIMIKVR